MILSVIHDGHAVAQPLRLLHVMRRQNDRAPGLLQPIDQIPQMAPRLRIETCRRLIQKQQLRIADQRARHGQPLLLPARQPAYARLSLLFELRDLRSIRRP